MTHRLFLPLLLVGAVLLALTACSDPTGVGATDSLEGGTPRSIPVEPTLLDTTSVVPETGFSFTPEPGIDPTSSNRSWRFLAGAVKDPITGPIQAEGYVDFFGTAPRDSSIQEASPSSLDAELRLQPTYFHGETASILEVNLFTLDSEADMSQATADTSFAVARQLSPPSGVTYSINPGDSLITLPLPESWIRTHLAPLQADSAFGNAINGFKIAAANEPTANDRKVVAGFDHRSATLRLTTETDTVDFSALKSFTHIEHERTDSTDNPELPLDDWTVLQDGAGIDLIMNWDAEAPPLDTLQNTPLNRADITVPIDATKMSATLETISPSFVRPSANNFRVLATLSSETTQCSQLGLPQFSNEEGTCILPTLPRFAPDAARLTPETAFRIFEDALFNTLPFSRLRVEIAVQEDPNRENAFRRGLPSTVPVLVRTANGDVRDRPHATLVVTPL